MEGECNVCPPPPKGEDGMPGSPGMTGKMGERGVPGCVGVPGSFGPPGDIGLPGPFGAKVGVHEGSSTQQLEQILTI